MTRGGETVESRTKIIPEPADAMPVSTRLMTSASRWTTLLVGAVLLAVWGMIALHGLRLDSPDRLRVFGSFWAAGWAVRHQLNPYVAYPLTWTWRPFVNSSARLVDLNLSAPAMLPLLSLVSREKPGGAILPWTCASVLLYVVAAVILLWHYGGQVQRRQLLWLLLAPATLDTLSLGQDYGLFVLLAAAGCVLLDRRHDWLAGFCIGALVAVRPNFALWIVLLALCGRRKAAVAAAAACAVFCSWPAVIYGRAVYAEWASALRHDAHLSLPTDISLAAFFSRLGHPQIGLVASGLLLACLLVYAGLRRSELRQPAGLALCAGLLCSPLAWVHYTPMLAGPLFSRPWSRRFTWMLVPSLLPFTVAWLAWNASPLASFLAGCCYCLPVCAMLVWFLTGGTGRASRDGVG